MSKPDLASRPELLRFLRRHGLAPQKALGQHYLVSARVAASIIHACGKPGGILEIGPGPGVLTQRCEEIAPTIALDVDPRVGTALGESAPLAKFVLGDVLQVDLRTILRPLKRPRVVVSNLPYNIATAVVEKLASIAPAFDLAVLMMQKEVSDRLLAEPGRSERGWLSVVVRCTFEARKICEVRPGAFVPTPKVCSTVVSLTVRQPSRPVSEKGKALLIAAFRQPRKTLANNLASSGFGRKSEMAALIEACGLAADVRPHFLTEEDWRRLARRLRIPMS